MAVNAIALHGQPARGIQEVRGIPAREPRRRDAPTGKPALGRRVVLGDRDAAQPLTMTDGTLRNRWGTLQATRRRRPGRGQNIDVLSRPPRRMMRSQHPSARLDPTPNRGRRGLSRARPPPRTAGQNRRQHTRDKTDNAQPRHDHPAAPRHDVAATPRERHTSSHRSEQPARTEPCCPELRRHRSARQRREQRSAPSEVQPSPEAAAACSLRRVARPHPGPHASRNRKERSAAKRTRRGCLGQTPTTQPET